MGRDIMRELIVHLAERGQIDQDKADEWVGLIDKGSKAMDGMMRQLEQLNNDAPQD
jgi:hypothetical protein